MHPVIIFDVSHNMTEAVAAQMSLKKYYRVWESNGKRYVLPSNVLWKQDSSREEALADIRMCVNDIKTTYVGAGQVKLLRCIVLNCTPWGGIAGVEAEEKDFHGESVS